MKIFVKPYFLKTSYLYYYSQTLGRQLEPHKQYTLVNHHIMAEVAIIQIGEINDLNNLPPKPCLLYFHFCPDADEVLVITNILDNLETLTEVVILSPYNNLLGKVSKYRLVEIPWGCQTKQFRISSLSFDEPINVYYPDDLEDPSHLISQGDQVGVKFFPYHYEAYLCQQETLKDAHLVLLREQWQDVFPPGLTTSLNLGIIPILSGTIDKLKIYQDYVLTLNHNNPLTNWFNIFSERRRDLTKIDFTAISWKSHFSLLDKSLEYLWTQNNPKSPSFLFVPFLDLQSQTNTRPDITPQELSHSDKITILAEKCQGKWNSFSSSGHYHQFFPWGLSHCYTRPDQGIYINRETYQQAELPDAELKGYTSFPMMSFNGFNRNSTTPQLPGEIVKTLDGTLKTAMEPFHRWRFSESNAIYVKMPECQYPFALVTWISQMDYLPFLRASLNHLNKIITRPDQCPIFVFSPETDGILVNGLQALPKEYPNLTVKLLTIPVSYGILEDIHHGAKFKIITSLMLCPARTILFFKPNVYFLTNPEEILDENITDSLFFQSSRGYRYPDSGEFKKWSQLNLRYPDHNPDGLSESCFLYQREKDWYSLLISMGLSSESFLKELQTSDLLKLGLLANQAKYLVKNKETIVKCFGTSHEGLIVGFPVRKWKSFYFTEIPLWIRISLPTHQVSCLENKPWYFETLMWSLVTGVESSEKLDSNDKILEVSRVIRKMSA